MEFRTLVVPPGIRPERIDRWLARQLPDVSRSRIQQWIRDGEVTMNGAPVAARDSILAEAHIQVRIPEETGPSLPEAEEGELELLFEDEDLIAVNKPAGLVVHPAPGHPGGTLINHLLFQFPDLNGVGDPERPGLVHRLDADTSGVILFARSDKALTHLQDQFRNRQTRKTYRACCPGIPSPIQQTVNAPIGRHPSQRQKRAVNGTGAKEAVTHFNVTRGLASGQAAELEVRIETGRTHQIRVHLTHIGHPVLGDTLYAGRHAQLPGAWPKAPRQMLHAHSLEVTHPRSETRILFEAPLASDMAAYMEGLS